jgi:MinD superfamily P-loop ATPase
MSAKRTIAIASGKGGTGKTTVAVNLAWHLAEQGMNVRYVDCDVEEPNGHLFLNPVIATTEPASIPTPVVDAARCTGCRACAEACQYNAIAVLQKALVFPELCHGCGGCTPACPTQAIREEPRAIGTVETGVAGKVHFVQGRINVGEAMAPPLIRAALRKAFGDGITLLDAPPGTSCPMVTTVRQADYVVLVTEPTPFGLHDLALAVETVRKLGRPHGVVINRADSGDGRVRDYCGTQGIPVLIELPDDRRVAEAYSRGELAARVLPDWRLLFESLSNLLENQPYP